jgi:carboxyl-terminal processing protease
MHGTRRLIATGALLTLAYFLCVPMSAANSTDLEALRIQAKQHEQQFDWNRACDIYEEILRINRNLPEVRERYRHCLRRANQVIRHQDSTYRKEVLALKYELSLRLFETIFHNLLDSSLEKRNVDAGRLFRKGLEEFTHALADPFFCQEHLRGKTPKDTHEFRKQLHETWGSRMTLTRAQAVEQVREVAMKALRTLNLSATTVVMEFTCGACHGLDDYTVYLTPGQLRVLSEALRGEVVGVGLKLEIRERRLVVAEVVMGSPAGEQLLAVDDHILSIDKKATADLTVETAQSLLEGEPGTSVELFISSPTTQMMRTVTLKRRPIYVPSVTPELITGAIGYLKISTFQETTVQELDNALVDLINADVKVLILDLRGNRGGLMDVAIETAERFLPKGKVIVSTEHSDSKFNAIYHSRSEPVFALPLIVLVDGDTASAAEVVVGALKEHGRARVVGQTTFGKGCSQEVVRLPSQGLLKLPPETGGVATGGLRITVARFLSPNGFSYTGRGVSPHRFVERPAMPGMTDLQREEATREAQRQLDMVR